MNRVIRLVSVLFLIGNCQSASLPLQTADGAEYYGETRNGQPHGEGIKIWSDSSKMSGKFSNGQCSGIISGKNNQDNYFLGEQQNCITQGRAVIFNGSDSSVTVGEFDHGKAAGRTFIYEKNGTLKAAQVNIISPTQQSISYSSLIYPNGSHYVGQFNGEVPHGMGNISNSNGEVLIGKATNGKISGICYHYVPGKGIYQTEIKNDQPYPISLQSPYFFYIGQFNSAGNPDGRGRMINYQNGRFEEGQFRNGEFYSPGNDR